MTILRRQKGSLNVANLNLNVASLNVSDPKIVTTDFGTKIESPELVDDDADDAKVEVDPSANDSGMRGLRWWYGRWKLDIGDVYNLILGNIGKYQLRNAILMGMTGLTLSWISFGAKFLTYDVDYWCSKPENLSLSTAHWLNLSSPLKSDGSFDRCNIFDVDYDVIEERPEETTPIRSCQSWEFAKEPFQNTIKERWSMVCDRDNHFKTIGQSVLFVGHFAGALAAGFLADWFGRKTGFLVAVVPAIGFLLASAFIDNPWAWVALRFFIGMSTMATTTIKSVYVVEWTGGRWRSFAQHYFIETFFYISHMTTGLLIYLIPDMKTFELVMALAIVPFLALYFVIPESPRWLISKHRIDEAKAVLEKALKVNKMPLSLLHHLDKVERKEEKSEKNVFVTDLLHFPGIRRNLICMALCWFCIAMANYGLIYNTPSFDWNVYITFVMPAFFSFPVLIVQPFIENKIGRKWLYTFLMAISGILLLCTLAIPKGMFPHNWPIMTFAWIGTISCNFALALGYVYGKELFPTTHRTLAVSTASACARLGGIASPYVALLEVYDPILVLALYGLFLIAGAGLSVFIWPDTNSRNIPGTLEECEEMSKIKIKNIFCKS